MEQWFRHIWNDFPTWKVVLVHLPVIPSKRDGTVVSLSEDRLRRRGTRRDCKGDVEYSLNILQNSPTGRIYDIRGIEPLVQDMLPEQLVSGLVIQARGAVRNMGHANISSTASAPKKLILWGLKPTNSNLYTMSLDGDTPSPNFGLGYCGVCLLSIIYKLFCSMLY